MPPIRMTVHVQGLQELRRNADLAYLIQPAFKAAMEQIAQIGLSVARGVAPVGQTGQTQAKMRTRMSHRPLPLWVAVETTATRSSAKYPRYPYPKRLEFDPTLHHAGWLGGGIRGAVGRFEGALKTAAHAIESRWGAR